MKKKVQGEKTRAPVLMFETSPDMSHGYITFRLLIQVWNWIKMEEVSVFKIDAHNSS